MSNFIQSIENLFANASAWGTTLPQFVLVPLVMLLATIGTVVIVTLLMGLMRLVFGQKAIDFIKNIPKHLNNAAIGVSGPQNGQQPEKKADAI